MLSGIVGSGKTTLIEHILEILSDRFELLKYSGDDVSFRAKLEQDSTFIFEEVSSKTSRRALIFVDEVQKTEAVFDALKIAFDRGKYSFIVSGSNPAFLDTVAKKRLQRRAEYLSLTPFTIPEILKAEGVISLEQFTEVGQFFDRLLKRPNEITKNLPELTLTPEIQNHLDKFLIWGGLPLAYFDQDETEKLREIRRVVERGFEPMSSDAKRYADTIRVELASLHSKEFAYQGLFQKTGLRRREAVNEVIDDLINHGYLTKKKPLVLEGDRRSYLTVYSYIDPGIVTYLRGGNIEQIDKGAQLEGYIQTRLTNLVQRSPYKTELWYYKPYQIDGSDKLKFAPGEIDFIVKQSELLMPIEVKLTTQRGVIDTTLLRTFVKNNKTPFGIVLYGGVPYWESKERLLFWPYWLV